jgi:hypothetical protein
MSADEDLVWFGSSSCDAGACVQVAMRADQVFVRDRADEAAPRLACSRDAWRRFLAAVRAGEFDLR